MNEEYEDYEDEASGEWRVGLSLGFLGMLPLLVAYEAAGASSRSTAEMLLLRLLALAGDLERPLRWVLLAAATAAAVTVLARVGRGVAAALGRVALEGAGLALLLGPALVGLLFLLGIEPPALADPEAVPTPARAAFVFGAAAWEELLFRVGAYSALYLLGRRLLQVLGAGARLATGVGELCGLMGSAFLFAAAHLAAWTAWLGPGGEPYDASVFTWRLVAGILLGLVFRWRGPGVAAWTHGLFNLSLLLGAGPDVFL